MKLGVRSLLTELCTVLPKHSTSSFERAPVWQTARKTIVDDLDTAQQRSVRTHRITACVLLSWVLFRFDVDGVDGWVGLLLGFVRLFRGVGSFVEQSFMQWAVVTCEQR